MNFILTVYFKSSLFEYFLPGVNNRTLSVEIPPEVSGYEGSLYLSLAVWDNVWRMTENASMGFLGRGGDGGPILLGESLNLECEMKPSKVRFAIVVDQNYEGYSDFDKYLLCQGRITIGSAETSTVRYNARNLVSSRHAVIEAAADGSCAVTDSGSSNGTFVNGARISGRYALSFGDIIQIIGLKIVFLGDALAINRPSDPVRLAGFIPYVFPERGGALLPSGPGDDYYQRSPRQIELPDDETVEIEAPPNPGRNKRQPLIFTVGPSMTMVIPMAAGVLFSMWSVQQSGSGMTSPFMFMGIITSITAAFIGVFWALANYRYSKKTEAVDEKRRNEAYRKYLDKTRGLLTRKHIENKDILVKKYPETRECLRYTKTNSRRLWERNVNHQDFLTIRIGMGNIPSPNEVSVPKERFSLVDDDLAEAPRNIREEYKTLKNVPICISLKEHNLIGIIGDSQEKCDSIARAIATQIASYHAYTDVRLMFIFNEKELGGFEFAKWLPHTWAKDGSLRMMAHNPTGVGELLYDLSAVLRDRLENENGEKAQPIPHYVVFISDPSLVENEAAMKYLSAPNDKMGLTTVLIYGQISRLPNNCTVIIESDEDYSGYYSLDGSFDGFENVVFDSVPPRELDEYARSLSGIRVREMHSAGAAPQLLTFLDMYKTSRVEDIDVGHRWLENRAYESMRAIIGYRGADLPLYLDIHEKYHGPHGLVAGTTGSGKSETLQTYILSLALNYHPHEVSFILIDYKGGGMAGSFESLPHVAGIITNLGGNQTNRALASINSEIKRRQAIFNEFKIKHIDDYIELFRAGKAFVPIPHLPIIADEFAELKKEQSEFVRELVSASRVGRSLGVHLILATQKPSGVVDDEIWSNSKFRLCLRVQDKMDSNEMIRRPDAAYITNVGRGYFQVGNDELFEMFQSGWSGAEYTPEIPYADSKRDDVRMINLWGKPCVIGSPGKMESKAGGEKRKTQLEATVAHIAGAAKKLGVGAIDNIWLAPLPTKIALREIPEYAANAFDGGAWKDPKGSLAAVAGVVDDPVNQRQEAFILDFIKEGHVMLTASGLGGKTTFLQTVLYSLVTTYSPKRLSVYIADFGSRTMGVFGELPHTGGIAFDSDYDKVDKLIAMLLKELARRKLSFSEKGIGSFKEYSRIYDDVPAILFVIDNYAAFSESFPKQENNMIMLSREAASYGIYLVITCANTNDVRGRIRQNINFGIGMQLADRFEYEDAINGKTEILAEDRTPGRGLVCYPKPLEFQTALSMDAPDDASLNMKLRARFAGMAKAWSGARAPAIPQVPGDMSAGNFLRIPEVGDILLSGRYLPVGYDLVKAEPVSVDIAKIFCYSISGAARSGKTNMLKVFMRLAKARGGKIYVFDGYSRELESYSEGMGADGYMTTSEELFGFMETVMVPEFSRRNKAKRDFIKGGRKNVEEYIGSEQEIFLFIGDIGAFCSAVYTSERNMKDFMEQMAAQGDLHMIYIFACVSSKDMTGEYGATRFLKIVTDWKEGLHLGGDVEHQRIFDFDVPVLERGKKLQPGVGHIINAGVTKRIVTPIAE